MNPEWPKPEFTMATLYWRLGKFQVKRELLNSPEAWRKLLPLMSRVVVIRTLDRFENNTIEYLAFSDLFQPILMGEEAPQYQLTCSTDPKVPIRAERISSK